MRQAELSTREALSPAVRAAAAGLLTLAAGVGIGRFLYTPVLPMMAAGAGLDPRAGGLIAAANFAGYLLGALLAGLSGRVGAVRWVLLGALGVSALTTAAMALPLGVPLWAGVRFAGGLASAFVLVGASALVVRRLAALGRPELAAVHFAGVGVGIGLSALIASPLLATPDSYARVWLWGGALSALAVVLVGWLLPREGVRLATTPPSGTRGKLGALVLAYGCLGLGYVVTATFLVAILREDQAGRWAETWIWLVVGVAAIPSVWLWSRLGLRYGAARVWRWAMLIEATGVALSALAGGVLALGLAALALGATFMGLTALGLQEAARRTGGDGQKAMGLMTASFGLGQMLGPALTGVLRETTGSYVWPSLIAAAVLVAGAFLVREERLKDGAP